MSKETFKWLNTRTLIGMTDKRGNAWHYRIEYQEDEPNHYSGFIPVEDVVRRLFDFKVEATPIYVKEVAENSGIAELVQVPDKLAWRTNDTGEVLGVFSDGYVGHQYSEWLLDEVANILDDDLGIGSAGLLRNRGQAWVSVEVPDNIVTPEGVEFRPNLLAATSFDGSLATTYKRVVTNVVCDNTMFAGLSESGQQVKLRHSKYSALRIGEARQALAIVHSIADDFAREVERLCQWEVSSHEWSKLLDLEVPVPDNDGRGRTLAENKRYKLIDLYTTDDRCDTWAGTAYGVLQTFNTFNQHYAQMRGIGDDVGAGRYLRSQEYAINGKTERADLSVLKNLSLVCQ